ncbi:hypothetical protein AGOR_G00236110 [Albula goreensis]|uniref:Uncharacterized protein n=1 Tax=Albula goreensis TaxID=1534307 RepID=A0A8T3CIR3_9TELE|nr:hypothetical protein AGOR_G00236110 [Albula goreensis]
MMVKSVFVSLICMYIQVPVQSQTPNPLDCMDFTAYEISVLALLGLIGVLCTITVTGVFILLRKLNKIGMTLSEKDSSGVYVNDFAGHRSSDALSFHLGDPAPTHSQLPTRASSLRLSTNQTQEPFQVPENPSSHPSSFRSKPPPDYEDTMSRLARQSRVLRSVSLQGPASAMDISYDDSQSHYMEMKSCTISAFSTGLEESIYDTPRYSHGLVGHAPSTQSPPPFGGLKHSRFNSDPSGYPRPKTFPAQKDFDLETYINHPRGPHQDGRQEPETCTQNPRELDQDGTEELVHQPQRPAANSRPQSFTHQTSEKTAPSGQKHSLKSSVRSKQRPVDI